MFLFSALIQIQPIMALLQALTARERQKKLLALKIFEHIQFALMDYSFKLMSASVRSEDRRS